jgi:peptide/nickel transport system substrate-binding protein
MKKKVLFALVVCLLISSFLSVSCSKTTTTTPPALSTTSQSTTAKPPTTTTSTTQAHWWDKYGTPQYGGTASVAVNRASEEFDPYNFMGANVWTYEQLFIPDLTIDRSVWNYKVEGEAPKYNGLLAQSWEFKDAKTMIIHLRQGVKWQNKAPVNGREFTADDVVYHYDRELGTGSGFTKMSPFAIGSLDSIVKVTALDKYTVEVNFKDPMPVVNWWTMINPAPPNQIEPREIVTEKNHTEWQNACGTGALTVTDFASGAYVTFSRNSDYYLDDERYPNNRLPYIDIVKQVAIPDKTTQLAALRTAKVDMVIEFDWQNAESLKKTNPEIILETGPDVGLELDPRLDKQPLSDINVRKALQMAIDIPSIAKNHYGGYVSSDPPGFLAEDYGDWNYSYKDWPQDLKDEYAYNPTTAKKLLADAGYPNGFETNIYVRSDFDMPLYQIIKSEFSDIGVNMQINPMDFQQMMPFTGAGKHDQMMSNNFTNQVFPLQPCFSNRISMSPWNKIFTPADQAAVYDKMYNDMLAAPDTATAKKLGLQMQEYIYRQHWAIITTGRVLFTAYQSRLKGYSGEYIRDFPAPWFWTRFWLVK